MSILDGYTTQKIPYLERLGSDTYGKDIFADEIRIPCRMKPDQKTIHRSDGSEVVSEAVVYTTHRVGPMDAFVIAGVHCPVLSATVHYDLDGQYDHMEVRI